MLVAAAPPVVSFTFGLPGPAAPRRLKQAGCLLVQTVTSCRRGPDRRRSGDGRDGVQSADAGGHWGTFTPDRPPERLPLPDLVRAARATTDLP